MTANNDNVAVNDPDPPPDCPLCPRLAAFRQANKDSFPGWFNAPVSVWGDPRPRLLVVGLAPGLRGANRTGRPFTGDFAGDLLFATLSKFGAAEGSYRADPDDGLQLRGVAIVNAVRCVPPQNKPTGPEIGTCRQFLAAAIAQAAPQAFLALGRIAHDSLLTTIGERRSALPFRHGADYELGSGQRLFSSYHCSRYNTNTGVLTAEMFEDVVGRALQAARG